MERELRNIDFLDEKHLQVGDEVFAFGYPFPFEESLTTPPILKPRELITQLESLLLKVSPERIIELGVNRGGSTALIASLVCPERMVAIDLSAEPSLELRRFLYERYLTNKITTHYGIDQADTATLADILDNAFGGAPIDFVIDDASHHYSPTRRSFELIFPRLRTGGLFVIEDWAGEHKLVAKLIDKIDRRAPGWESLWQHIRAGLCEEDRNLIPAEEENDPRLSTLVRLAKLRVARNDVTPLSRFGLELLCASADSLDIIRRIEVTWGFFIVERGKGEISEGPWLDELTMDVFGALV